MFVKKHITDLKDEITYLWKQLILLLFLALDYYYYYYYYYYDATYDYDK